MIDQLEAALALADGVGDGARFDLGLIAVVCRMRVDGHPAYRVANGVIIRRSIVSGVNVRGMMLVVPVMPL
jgi:hypothetical protein